MERRTSSRSDRLDRRRRGGCVRRRLGDASGGRGGRRRPGDAVPHDLSRRCGGRGRAPPPRAARLRRAAARLRPVSRAFARGAAGLSRRGPRAQPLDGRDGNPAGAAAARTVGGEPRAAVGADRGERARRALRADVGQSRHDSRGSRARARRDAERRVVARPARRGRPLDAGAGRAELTVSRPCTRVRRVRARARRCRGRLGHAPALRRRGGRARQLAAARGDAARRQRRRPDPHPVVPRRAGDRRDARPLPRRGARGRGRRAGVARRAAAQGRRPLPRHGRERLRLPRAARAHGRRAAGSRGRARSRCTLQLRWRAAARSTGAAATRFGRATSAPPSTSPIASTGKGGCPSPEVQPIACRKAWTRFWSSAAASSS